MLIEERAWLHVLPTEAHTARPGETRRVDDDQTIRWGSVRYSTPDGHQGAEVWCRVLGDELVIVADDTERGLVEIVRHELSPPQPRWRRTRTTAISGSRRGHLAPRRRHNPGPP